MREITKEEATRLRHDGQHGFWAVWVNPVTVHQSGCYVINMMKRWFVVGPDEFKLVPMGIVRVPVPAHLKKVKGTKPMLKQVHAIECSQEIHALIQQDTARAQNIILDGIPVAYGNSIKPKDE